MTLQQTPVAVAATIIALLCVVAMLEVGPIERVEWMTYDWRVRLARGRSSVVTTNLGVVKMTDLSVRAIKRGAAYIPWGTNRAKVAIGTHYGLYWPRNVYGRLIRELKQQGALAVGFDVYFGETRDDHPWINAPGLLRQNTNDAFLRQFIESGAVVELPGDQVQIRPDVFLALQLRSASNVILAGTSDGIPPEIFLTNAVGVGDIRAESDEDGVLRRARAFSVFRNWHPAFKQAAKDFGVLLEQADIQKDRITLLTEGDDLIPVKLDANGDFDLTDFVGEDLPPGYARKNKPFTEERIWSLGVVLAARALGLKLNEAEVDLEGGRIVIRGPNGISRVLPVDREGWFYIDWELKSEDPRLTTEPIEALIARDELRTQGHTDPTREKWKGKLVVMGSEATGHDLTDRGATPLEKDVPLMTKHWNVANSIIQDRFVTRAGIGMELAAIILMGVISALLTLRLRILFGLAAIVAAVAAYAAVAVWIYVAHRYWLPLVLPICGAGFVEYAVLATYRVIFEQDEKRKVKSLFSRLVSPNIVNELLQAKQLSLGGARREITVLFADVRGFTELTDKTHEKVLEEITARKLGPDESERYQDEAARNTLVTVNLYLGMLADIVKRHDGTLDKYIGDCVMAFWGAPSVQPLHALACVRAAIDAQRAISRLNHERQLENTRREADNLRRQAAGQPLLPMLPVLQMGSGVNTGLASVGLMGSAEHIYNYTVFGREVNLASRLESLSGRSRIIIGETTFKHLQRDDPGLAATCRALQPEKVKGFRDPVQVYEVPWQETETPGTAANVTLITDADVTGRKPATPAA